MEQTAPFLVCCGLLEKAIASLALKLPQLPFPEHDPSVAEARARALVDFLQDRLDEGVAAAVVQGKLNGQSVPTPPAQAWMEVPGSSFVGKLHRQSVRSRSSMQQRPASICMHANERDVKAIVPEKPGTNENEALKIKVDPNILRGNMGGAWAATSGLEMNMIPVVGELVVEDTRVVADLFPKLVRHFCTLTLLFFAGLGSLSFAYCPFAVMSYTNASQFLTNFSTVNASVVPLREPPWGREWEQISVVVHDLYCCAAVCGIFGILAACNIAAMRLLWQEGKWTLVCTLGSSLVYAASVGVLLPSQSHLLWLVLRTSGVVFLSVSDSVFVSVILRYTPKRFTELWGGDKKGPLSWAAGITGLSFVCWIISVTPWSYISRKKSTSLPLQCKTHLMAIHSR